MFLPFKFARDSALEEDCRAAPRRRLSFVIHAAPLLSVYKKEGPLPRATGVLTIFQKGDRERNISEYNKKKITDLI